MALPNYADIMQLVKQGLTLEAQEKIMELRTAALQLQEDNINLRERIKALEEAAAVRESVTWEAPFYWRKLGGAKDGPFCQKCYDDEGKLVRAQDLHNGYWRCFKCAVVYG